jgi:hypothetical protein
MAVVPSGFCTMSAFEEGLLEGWVLVLITDRPAGSSILKFTSCATRNFHPGPQVWAPWLPLYVISRREGGREGWREGGREEEGGRGEWEEVGGEAMISV